MKNILLLLLSAFIAIITSIIFDNYTHPETEKAVKKLSGALQAFDFWTKQRAYPKSDIPADAYYRAFEKNKMLSKRHDLLTSWEEMGPHNIGGRTISLAINPLNPNTVYAGSASGGLWRSNSGGAGIKAWSYVSTGHPVLSVGSIVIHPADTSIMYIGTGEVYGYQISSGGLSVRITRGSYGIGILKTTDGGNTWIKSLDWSYDQKRGVQVIKMDPANSDILFAGTSEGLYKTINAGATWNHVHNIVMTTDILINKQNPNIIIEACGNLNSPGKGIYRSTDGGSTWNTINTNIPNFGGKILLADVKSDPNIYWASVGIGTETNAGTYVLRSSNAGASWTIINNQTDYATYQGWYSHFVVPHASNPQNLLFGGIDIWKSTNGGSTILRKTLWNAWYFGVVPIGGPEGPSNYSHADHHCYAIHPTNPDIVYFGTDGGIFKTTDFGNTYTGCNGSYQTTQFYKRFSASKTDSTRAVGGMQDNATAVWEGTFAWRRVLGGDGCCTQISPTRADTMFGSSQYLGMARSVNKGVNWNYLTLPSSNEAFNAPFLIAPNNSKVIYAGGERLHKSTNAGSSWVTLNSSNPLNGDPILSIAVSYSNPDTVFVTTAPNLHPAAIFRSTNGGQSFTNITGTLPDRYPVDISVDPVNSSKVYCVFSGFGTSHLFTSADGGSTWSDISSGLPDVPTSAIAIDPFNSDILYVGNDVGLFYSINKGVTWLDANNNIEGALLIMDLAVSPLDKKLIVATHGRGVYRVPLATISTVTGISGTNSPSDYRLYQNYPNPFNGSTVIKFFIPQAGFTSLKLYDATGREVKELISGNLSAGSHEYTLGSKIFNHLSSGIYFYKITSDKYSDTKKLVLLK